MEFINGRVTEVGLRKLRSTVNAPENPVVYLGIDPGKHNGICGYDARCYLQFMYTIEEDDLAEFLDCFEKLETIVIESFKLYPNKAQKQIYSDMVASRMIGAVNNWAKLKKVPVAEQGSSIKETAYKWLGKKALPKSNPLNHQFDAHAHFIYWAICNEKMKASDLIK